MPPGEVASSDGLKKWVYSFFLYKSPSHVPLTSVNLDNFSGQLDAIIASRKFLEAIIASRDDFHEILLFRQVAGTLDQRRLRIAWTCLSHSQNGLFLVGREIRRQEDNLALAMKNLLTGNLIVST